MAFRQQVLLDVDQPVYQITVSWVNLRGEPHISFKGIYSTEEKAMKAMKEEKINQIEYALNHYGPCQLMNKYDTPPHEISTSDMDPRIGQLFDENVIKWSRMGNGYRYHLVYDRLTLELIDELHSDIPTMMGETPKVITKERIMLMG
jgi:hypothetical protein